MPSENQVMNEYYFPARILHRTSEIPEEETLRNLIKGDLGGATPYFFRAEISSSRVDSHFTHMLDSTLQNFANEAEVGVSFLDSHQRRKLGIGYTLTGTFDKSEIPRVVSDLYTVPGINLGNHSYASTDDFIRAMRAALVRKVSVGFHGGDMICDICGNSFWDFRNCRHWPGRKYTIDGDNGDGEEVTATFGISDAHLAEVSAVYEGSTPGAMILRAEGMAQAGLLDGEEIRRLETQYRIKLPTGRRTWTTVGELSQGSSIEFEIKGEKQQMEEIEQQIIEILSKTGAPQGVPLTDAIKWLADENARLAALADQGREYRADLVKQALAEGVRAMGDSFPEETYRQIFEGATIEHIKLVRDSWAKQAAAILKGGRKTVDDEQQPTQPQRQPVSAAPDSAYKS